MVASPSASKWGLFHHLGSLRLLQQHQRPGVAHAPLARRVSILDRRALSSNTADSNARALKPFKGLKKIALNYSSSSGATVQNPNSESDAQTKEPLPPDLPRLSPEQERVVNLAASGQNIFYTGSAGSGKSTVLHAIVKRLRGMGKRVRVVAPTGKAALAINGTTTWTFAGWKPDCHKLSIKTLKEMARIKTSIAGERFRRTDVVIIDEISMVENLHFERLNQVMKAARHKPGYPAQKYPFGGVQVIVTGDFAQLPPVRPFRHCIKCGSEMEFDVDDEVDEEIQYHCGRCDATYNDSDKWAFQSKAWAECNFAYIYLDKIHRQHDAGFISLLNKCRLGEAFTPEEVDLLMTHETSTTGAVELYSTREEVRLVNERGFRKLGADSYSFRCRDDFHWNSGLHPHLKGRCERHEDGSLKALDEHAMDRLVQLKCGMPVLLLVNLELRKGLCNGSQGVIVGWTPHKRGEHRLVPSGVDYAGLKEVEIKRYVEALDSPVWPIVRFSNGIERPIQAECQVNELGDEEPYSLLCRTQIPLAPAWALSIHKAQGMTLNKVKVDVSKAFSHGQVYVALSRATSLQGLEVGGNADGLMFGVGANKEVRSFYKNKFGL